MIPKRVINSWFSRSKKNDLFEHCLATQRAFCRDWEFIYIDEGTEELMAFPFMQAVVDRKEWCKATSLARIWGLWKHGGVYLDADVEVLRPLDDLLGAEFFTGWEDENYLCDAIMGSIAGGGIVSDLLAAFPSAGDGSAGSHAYGPTFYTTQLRHRANPGLALHPPECFYPAHWRSPDKPNITSNTYAYHRYAGSWVDKY